MAKIGPGAEVVVIVHDPGLHRAAQLAVFKLGFKPQLVVCNVGSDPTTLSGLLKAFAKGKAGDVADRGHRHRRLHAATRPTPSNSWIQLFKKVHDKYNAKLPIDGNVGYGMALAYTFAQALQEAGQEPDPPGAGRRGREGRAHGPGPRAVPLRADSHAGFTGVQIGEDHQRRDRAVRPAADDRRGSGPIQPYTGAPPRRRPTASRRRSDAEVRFLA